MRGATSNIAAIMALAANITRKGRIWYEPERVDTPDARLFDPDAWREEARVQPAGRGRGAAWFIDIPPDRRYVLRAYRRGGMVGRLISDRYLFTGSQRTRPCREIQLLEHLERQGLPAPRPVAARFRRHGLTYCADILTERLPDTRMLSDCLQDAALPEETWRAIGQCIRRFHQAGVWHADLNAHNILLDSVGRVFLIDFDRGRIRTPGHWRESNLRRLARSLDKLAAGRPFHYTRDDWRALESGYEAGVE